MRHIEIRKKHLCPSYPDLRMKTSTWVTSLSNREMCEYKWNRKQTWYETEVDDENNKIDGNTENGGDKVDEDEDNLSL